LELDQGFLYDFSRYSTKKTLLYSVDKEDRETMISFYNQLSFLLFCKIL